MNELSYSKRREVTHPPTPPPLDPTMTFLFDTVAFDEYMQHSYSYTDSENSEDSVITIKKRAESRELQLLIESELYPQEKPLPSVFLNENENTENIENFVEFLEESSIPSETPFFEMQDRYYSQHLESRRAFLLQKNPLLWDQYPKELFESMSGIELLEMQTDAHSLLTDDDIIKIEKEKRIAVQVLAHMEALEKSQKMSPYLVPDLLFHNTDGTNIYLTPGDHFSKTKAFGIEFMPIEHHSLYIGRGYIIDVDGRRPGPDEILKVFQPGNIEAIKKGKEKMSGAKMYVRIIHILDYIKKMKSGSILSLQSNAEKAGSRRTDKSRKEIVHLAAKMIGPWMYNILFSNCETFANYCVRDKSFSDQAIIYQEKLGDPFKIAEKMASTMQHVMDPDNDIENFLKKYKQLEKSSRIQKLKVGSIQKETDPKTKSKHPIQYLVECFGDFESHSFLGLVDHVLENDNQILVTIPDPWLNMFVITRRDIFMFATQMAHQQQEKIPCHDPVSGALINPVDAILVMSVAAEIFKKKIEIN